MAVVDFEQIHRIAPAQASSVRGNSTSMGATTDATRSTLYDPRWGYFLFGQSISCEYDENWAYQDLATFTVTGVFSREAEGLSDSADEAAFNRLVAKYMALEGVFEAARTAAAPTAYPQWATADDKRCVELPAPLRDKDGKAIQAFPAGLRIEKGQYANEIRYTAVLREARQSAAKLVVNGVVLDNAEVTVTCPEPVFAHHPIVGTSGEVLQLKYYKTMEVGVSGTLPLVAAGAAVGDDAHKIAASLDDGKMKVEAALRVGSTRTVWSGLDVVEEASVEADYAAQTLAISIRARE